jgi:phage tail protein X
MAELTNILTDDGAVWSGTAPATNEITEEGAVWLLDALVAEAAGVIPVTGWATGETGDAAGVNARSVGLMPIVGWASGRIVKVPPMAAPDDPRYRTVEGDMLDAICLAELGSADHVPAVLEANPGLADLGPVFPAGVLIMLPDIGTPVATGEIRLWGESP